MHFAIRRRAVRCVSAVVAVLGLVTIWTGSAQAASVPYADSASVGQITLCDTSGNPITTGSIDTKPFVWRAVGSTAAKAPYNGTGRKAALFGYQPMQNVTSDLWYGQQLTASAAYTDAAHPMAAATPVDDSLADFMGAYPPKWDGLIQLRMFLGVPGQSTYTAAYNSASIRVSGKTWTLVKGGGGNCKSGTAESVESVLLPSVAALATPGQSVTSSSATSSPSASESASSSAASSASASSPSDASSATSNETALVAHQSNGANQMLWILIAVAAAAVVIGGVGWFAWRSRNAGPVE